MKRVESVCISRLMGRCTEETYFIDRHSIHLSSHTRTKKQPASLSFNIKSALLQKITKMSFFVILFDQKSCRGVTFMVIR